MHDMFGTCRDEPADPQSDISERFADIRVPRFWGVEGVNEYTGEQLDPSVTCAPRDETDNLTPPF